MKRGVWLAAASGMACLLMMPNAVPQAYAQEQQAAATDSADAAGADAEPLSAEEMEVLVARIALYPDELVAAIVAASLYPIQIVEAHRFLEAVKTKKDLKPDDDWDGSVISLLNYPEIITMMNDDLDWTEQLGDAATNQEKDLLAAIQQLRDKAVAKGVIKSDEKTVVVRENDNIVIQPATANEVYVPKYEPQVLYEPNYAPAPVTYYPEPYPSYYYPTATYFAGAVTGAVWAAAVDWDDWDVWDGHGHWDNDIDIDCNNCFNDRDFNGKVKWNDVDWSKVDRSKISFDKSQFAKFDRTKIKNGLKANDRNRLQNRAADLKRNRPSNLPAATGNRKPADIRKSTLDGLKKQSSADRAARAASGANVADRGNRPAGGDRVNRPSGGGDRAAKRPTGGKIDRKVGKPKAATRHDARPRKPSPMGDVSRGHDARSHSHRGGHSLGGGMGGRGGGVKQFRRPPGGHRGGRGGRRR